MDEEETEDQWEQWKDKIPPWLSLKTYKVAIALKMRAEEVELDLGVPMRAKRNGDSMWFMLTDGTRELVDFGDDIREIQHLTVLLCTPHGIFIEDNYRGNEVNYGVVSDADLYVEHLKGLGMRALSDDEFKRFLNGTL